MKTCLKIFKNGKALKVLAILIVLYLVLPLPYGFISDLVEGPHNRKETLQLDFSAYVGYFVTMILLFSPQIVLLYVLGNQQKRKFDKMTAEQAAHEQLEDQKG